MRVVVFADRPGAALSPLSDRTCVALLPVVGKPLIEHTAEALAAAGLKEALIVTSPYAESVEAAVGDGARWGMSFSYVLARGDETPGAVLGRLAARLDGDVLVVRGDVLRSPFIGEFVERSAAVESPVVAATVAGTLAGVWRVRGAAVVLPSDPERRETWRAPAAAVAIDGGYVALVDSLASYHRANIDAAAGRVPGLIVPGRTVAPGVTVGRQTRLALESVKGAPVFVGSRCDVKAGAELLADVVLADDVVVDRRATLRGAVVLPHTYIGELVDVSNAIVWTNDLLHVDTGAVARVTDAFLLADLEGATLTTSVADFCNRVVGLVLLIASVPLWPLLLIAGLLGNPRAPFRRVRLLGNRREPGLDGRAARCEFAAWETATRVPILRDLPKLAAVVAGHLRLVGVSPLTPAEAAAPAEEWEQLRDEAPVGLIGPGLLDIPRDAPMEERRVAEALYARTRSTAGDLRLLARGLAVLFTGRAWRFGPQIHVP